MELARKSNRGFAPLARWPEDVFDWFDTFLRPVGAGLMPTLDVEETDDAIIVEAEMPGVDPKDIDVSIRGNTLTIRGEKRAEYEAGQESQGQGEQGAAEVQAESRAASQETTRPQEIAEGRKSAIEGQGAKEHPEAREGHLVHRGPGRGRGELEYHRSERRWGTFVREITLPTGVDASKVQARCQNGVLTITLPKAETSKPRKIEVKS